MPRVKVLEHQRVAEDTKGNVVDLKPGVHMVNHHTAKLLVDNKLGVIVPDTDEEEFENHLPDEDEVPRQKRAETPKSIYERPNSGRSDNFPTKKQ